MSGQRRGWPAFQQIAQDVARYLTRFRRTRPQPYLPRTGRRRGRRRGIQWPVLFYRWQADDWRPEGLTTGARSQCQLCTSSQSTRLHR